MNDLLTTLLPFVPEKYRALIAGLIAVSPMITRAIYAVVHGKGLKGIFSSIWLGTNTPKAACLDAKPADDPNQKRLPLSILVTLCLCASVAMLGTGCAVKWGKFSIQPPEFPTNKLVRIEVRSIGINIGQNQATQTPEINLGSKSVTLTTVPVGIGEAASVTATHEVEAGFNASINERLETGPK